jgi:hypothetical protein
MNPNFDPRLDWREQWDARVAETAAALVYPPTPGLAARLRAERMAAVIAAREREARLTQMRRLAVAMIALIVLGVALWSVPPVRAAIVQFLRIGAVQITLVEPTPTPSPTAKPQPTTTPAPRATATLTPTPTITPTVTPRPLSSVLDLGGETTLEEARRRIRFPIRLPAYPSDLGQPDAVFVQELGDETVMLVWTDPAQPRRVRLALQELGPNAFVEKAQPRVIRETQVNGQRAIWAVGEYALRARDGDFVLRRLITGNTLIWKDGDITYRLETDLSMEEAVKIAESLH